MSGSKSWMIAGAVAGLLVARAPRADDPDAAQSPDPKEQAAPDEGAPGGTGSRSEGAGGGETGAPSAVPSGGDDPATVAAPRSAGDDAARLDAEHVAAGNTDGRG
jgi:hypothetical protein